MDKKAREKALLNLVYADEDYASITPSERPDFRLTHRYGGEFGVEVTEFYHTESRARIANIPGYVGEILRGGRHRHRDDIAPLALQEVTLVPHDDSRPEQQLQAVVVTHPPVDAYVDKVAELIEDKSERLAGYATGLDHTNLIVKDCEDRLAGLPADRFHSAFFTPRMEKALLKSDFREVYFIVKLGSFRSPRHVYIPLKTLFLVAALYFFNFVTVKEYAGQVQEYEGSWAALFAHYLGWRGARGVRYRSGLPRDEVAYGNTGVSVSEECRPSIYLYDDHPLPADLVPVADAGLPRLFGAEFQKVCDDYNADCTFTSPLAFDVRKEA